MEKLRAIRKAKGLTVQACADAVGVTHRTWTRWESLSADPGRDQRNAIADLLGVSLDELAGRADLPAVAG